jgi:hypothetical protein
MLQASRWRGWKRQQAFCQQLAMLLQQAMSQKLEISSRRSTVHN